MPESIEYKDLLNIIMNDDFMEKYTDFGTFTAFRYSSAEFMDWDHNPIIYSKEKLDSFVKDTTKFSNWEEMLQTAKGAL